MPGIRELLVAGVLAAWGLCCLLVYVPRFGRILRQMDRCFLIPEWRFFAPMPGQSDYHLLYKDWFPGGQSTGWTEVTSLRQRPCWCAAWNPAKRRNKALLDTVSELAQASRSNPDEIVLTAAYLNLLNYVSSLERSASPESVQFLLMHSHGSNSRRDPQMMFKSSLHKLC